MWHSSRYHPARVLGFRAGWWRRRPPPPSDDLVARLVADEETPFLTGLTVAVMMTEAGDPAGQAALREAIAIRARRRTPRFFSAGPHPTRAQARPRLLALARRGALLRNVYASGRLVAPFAAADDAEAHATARDVFAAGGPPQGFAFQLLFNELRCRSQA